MSVLNFPEIRFELNGTSPLLVHNERLANPLHAATKRLKSLTGKRKKTDDDLMEIARAEFDGGLYVDDDGPYIPDTWLLSMLRDAGKTKKLGKAVTQGVLVMTDKFHLDIGLTKKKSESWEDALWNGGYYDQRMVGNQQNRILRTRPRFETWRVSAEINYDPSVLDEREIEQLLAIAGVRIGIGDYRPRFGRFNARITN